MEIGTYISYWLCFSKKKKPNAIYLYPILSERVVTKPKQS